MSLAVSIVQRFKILKDRLSIRLLITVSLLALILARLDTQKIGSLISHFDLRAGAIMLAVNCVLFSLFALRWQLISAQLGFHPPFEKMLVTVWLAAFLGQFGPTIIISEITRFQSLRGYANSNQIISSQILDRVSGQIVLFAIALTVMPMYLSNNQSTLPAWTHSILAYTLAIAVLGSPIFYRYRKLFLQRFRKQLRILNPLKSPVHYGTSLLIQSALIFNFLLAAFGLGTLNDAFSFLIAVPLVLATTLLMPFAIADWGTRETAALLIFSAQGLSLETIVSISIIYGTFNLIATLPGGILLLHARSISTNKST